MSIKEEFRKYFIPDPAYFTYWLPQREEYSTVPHQHRVVTDTEIDLHLQGKQGLTVSPFVNDKYVKYGAIDIDVDDLQLVKKICGQLIDLNIQPNIFKSKSKGFHIYIFPEEPITAEKMIYNLRKAVKGGVKDEI